MLTLASLEPLMRDLVARDKVRIPPYPAVALRLQKTVQSGKYGLSDLAQITSADEVLTATILRIANSAFFRRGAKVTMLSDAISRLGAEELCRVALAASLGGNSRVLGPLVELRRTAWRQALASALCCQALARMRRVTSQDAFVCGLLHDFGRVVAVGCLEELLHNSRAKDLLSESDWQKIIDHFHVELGSMMAARWALPDVLATVIAYHHEPGSAPSHKDVVDMVVLADQVVTKLEDCPYLLPRDLEQIPGFSGPHEIESLMEIVPFIPGYIASMEEVGSTGHTGITPSFVEKPSSFLEDPRNVDFPVAWVRSNGENSFRARYVNSKGIAFAGGAPLPTGCVARLRLEPPDAEPFEMSGRVVLSTDEGNTFLMEVKFFALPNVSHDAWTNLLTRLSATPAA